MATIDELKKKDGSAVSLGAVRPNPAARGFAPSPAPNSFGDAAAAYSNPQVRVTPSAALNQPASPGLDAPPVNQNRGFAPASLGQPKPSGAEPAKPLNIFGDAAAASLDARVRQIPATGGAFPAPAPDGKGDTEMSRNVGNALSALPGAAPALGAMRGFAVAANAGGAGSLAAKISPLATPVAGFGALSISGAPGEQLASAAQTGGATGTRDAPAGPGNAASPKSAEPVMPGTPAAAQSAASTAADKPPAATTAAAPAAGMPTPGQVRKTMQPNGVTSYSGTDVSGDINLPGNRGGVISAQNNQAAENLARASGQTRGFGPSGAIRGGGQVSTMDTSAGFAADRQQLAENATARAASESNMQSQADYAANKVLEGRAMSGNRGALQILNNNARAKTEQRGQDIQSQGQQLTASSAKYTADANVKAQQASNETARGKLEIEQAKELRISRLDDLITSGTPLQQKMAASQKAAIMGRGLDASGKAPAGYRETADGGLEFIKGGPADPNTKPAGGKPLNDTQAKALLFGTRMQASGEILDSLSEAGKQFSTPGANGMAGSIVNQVNSAQGQQLDQAKRDFLNAVLRRESGAVIADTEFDNGNKQYFPQIGDAPEVIKQKRDNRMLAQRGILAEVPESEARVAQIRGAAQQTEANQSPVHLSELQRRAAANPDLARRLKEAGY